MENKNYTILLVDDDSLLLEMYAAKFKEKGFTVHTFERGEQVLAALKEGLVVDAILFDMVMPGMNGEALVTQLQKEKFGTGSIVIGLSNEHDEKALERMKNLGVTHYILKAQMVPSQMVAEVERLLNRTAK